MEGMSVADYMALSKNSESDGVFGDGGFLWVILIFLFFLAFSGNGLGFGNNGGTGGMAQVERDVLTTSCNTQKEVLESRYTTQLGFQNIQAQQAQCCCDLKTAIHAEGEETRALINANTIQALREDLQAAQLSLQNVAQTQNLINQLRPFPTPAYITCSPYTSVSGAGCTGCGNI